MHPYYYGGSMGMNGLGFELVSFIVHVLVIALVVWFLIWTLRGSGAGRRGRFGMWSAHSALSILNERFAKGEIDQKEYEERKKALMSHQ